MNCINFKDDFLKILPANTDMQWHIPSKKMENENVIKQPILIPNIDVNMRKLLWTSIILNRLSLYRKYKISNIKIINALKNVQGSDEFHFKTNGQLTQMPLHLQTLETTLNDKIASDVTIGGGGLVHFQPTSAFTHFFVILVFIFITCSVHIVSVVLPHSIRLST